jgi:hypothetical protein
MTTMSVNPTRRTFVSGILSIFGFLGGVGREPRAEARTVPVKEKPEPVIFTVRMHQPQMTCMTFVYDSVGVKR